jgi:hypothetical protein
MPRNLREFASSPPPPHIWSVCPWTWRPFTTSCKKVKIKWLLIVILLFSSYTLPFKLRKYLRSDNGSWNQNSCNILKKPSRANFHMNFFLILMTTNLRVCLSIPFYELFYPAGLLHGIYVAEVYKLCHVLLCVHVYQNYVWKNVFMWEHEVAKVPFGRNMMGRTDGRLAVIGTDPSVSLICWCPVVAGITYTVFINA